ncbi:MAG: PHP domain-containing protein [Treponema sp.]|jgi:hypothetical protein|nr:PHP domain-containing protein [Treponema sp.]
MNYQLINDPKASREARLSALKAGVGEKPGPAQTTGEVNNHIHTIYSFSPYTPSMAALKAREAGLEAAGSVDHDSSAAAEEMLRACASLGIGACVGFEVRVSLTQGPWGPTSFAHKKLNNPDSVGILYMTVQGIPKPQLSAVEDFLKSIRAQRFLRIQAMTEAANTLLTETGFTEDIDFVQDILDRSQYAAGGAITERHLLAAVAAKIIQGFGKGPALVQGLSSALGIVPRPEIRAFLGDTENPHYLYDLLGVLKSALLPRIYIPPQETECIPAQTVVDFARSIGAIPSYAYLGDVGASPTGDKQAEPFEDAYLEALFEALARIGYQGITYMPPRNTPAQLKRVRDLCTAWGFMEISGVDINSSRQSFTCPEVRSPSCRHLVDSTWALIAHERLCSLDPRWGLFSSKNPLAGESLASRLATYAAAGRALDHRHPEASAIHLAENLIHGRIVYGKS